MRDFNQFISWLRRLSIRKKIHQLQISSVIKCNSSLYMKFCYSFYLAFRIHSCPLYPYVLSFGQIPSLLAEQPISVLNRQYEEVAEFLHRYSGIHASLEELSISDQLVDWLKRAMKGISVCPCSDVSDTYAIFACCDSMVGCCPYWLIIYLCHLHKFLMYLCIVDYM